MKRSIGAFVCAGLLFSQIAIAATIDTPPNTELLPAPFEDVQPGSSFFLPIFYLKDSGVVHGYEDGTFKSDQEVTRAEALAMILKALRPNILADDSPNVKKIAPKKSLKIILPENTSIVLQDPETGKKTIVKNLESMEMRAGTTSATLTLNAVGQQESSFEDVSEKDWYANIVRRGKALGVVRGEGDGTKFYPNNTVNLAQALRMMFAASQINTENVNYSDSPLPPGISENEWYARDMAYSAAHGILMQQEDGRVFPPDKTLRRGELALILYRHIQNHDFNQTFGYASWYGDGLSVIRPKNNIEYVDKHMTAAHKTLPFGTLVRITNPRNGKQADIVINDRGPYVTGRVLDLSKSAFNAVGDYHDGVMTIQFEPIMIPSD